MKAVQVLAPGKAEFVETPTPELIDGHALIRPLHLSLCGSDIKMIHYSSPDQYPFPPGTSGHEMVGVVEAVGTGESNINVGDLTLTIAPEHRAMAEYYLAPFKNVIPLPEGAPLAHAASTTAWHRHLCLPATAQHRGQRCGNYWARLGRSLV